MNKLLTLALLTALVGSASLMAMQDSKVEKMHDGLKSAIFKFSDPSEQVQEKPNSNENEYMDETESSSINNKAEGSHGN